MSGTILSVVVAVDFEEASARAIAVGGIIAARHDARLTLVHAEPVEVPAYFTEAQVDVMELDRRALQQQAFKYLLHFGQLHTSRPFDIAIDDGPATQAILRRAHGADLVVLGTHGRRGPSRWWLGSVAERVLHDIDRPLIVVRGDAYGPPHLIFNHVVVHTSPRAAGDKTLEFARALAAPFNGEVDAGRELGDEPLTEAVSTTLVAIAAPHPRPRQWITSHGEPLVRQCMLPMLFVPETAGGQP